MKKNILLFFFLLLSSLVTQAQTKKGDSEKIHAFKVAFLTEKLDLTEKEAEKFWPLYNVYDKEMMQLHREERRSIKKRIMADGGIDNLSESESKQIIEKINAVSKEQYETKNEFYSKLIKILPYKKILRLEVAEYEFHRKLIRKLKGENKEAKK
ncbi:sensor of ECF-type sigma factor [Tenacibaculum sp. L6]|uniref:sensor of ECF-type sigma factor n=1 Tax=Tenacibaculum sp. L6 TaxID=2992764 RepID=UPI00237B675F|nr:sensor of ECF-type sigma factor [Tenacibaculum sp. L6]MDE0534875.1 sensor of ECF-type sigma factor [Tenacibaculum sp. L6]